MKLECFLSGAADGESPRAMASGAVEKESFLAPVAPPVPEPDKSIRSNAAVNCRVDFPGAAAFELKLIVRTLVCIARLAAGAVAPALRSSARTAVVTERLVRFFGAALEPVWLRSMTRVPVVAFVLFAFGCACPATGRPKQRTATAMKKRTAKRRRTLVVFGGLRERPLFWGS